MDWKQLKELIELVSEKRFAEFEVERQGFRLKITQTVPQPAALGTGTQPSAHSGSSEVTQPAASPGSPATQLAQAASPGPASAGDAAAQSLHIIKSPIVGTFYRAPSPTMEPFVKAGDRVEPDSVVCIIEAMKLMNEIQAEIGGIIADIYVENGQPVEYNQPLFGVRT